MMSDMEWVDEAEKSIRALSQGVVSADLHDHGLRLVAAVRLAISELEYLAYNPLEKRDWRSAKDVLARLHLGEFEKGKQ